MIFFARKNPRINHDFDDTDREVSLDMRKANAELKKAKQQLEIEKLRGETELIRLEMEQRRQELQEELQPEIPDNNDDIIKMLMAGMLAPKMQQNMGSSAITLPPEATAKVEISDETMNYIVQKVPKALLSQAKKAPEAVIRDYVRLNFPHASDDSIRRFIEKVRKI